MRRGVLGGSFSLILLGALSAWGQDRNDLSDRQHLNPLGATKSSDMQSFIERPLFAPTRRQAKIEDETNTESETPIESVPNFVLLGVTSGPEGSVARIAEADGKNAHSLRNGDVLEGWTVRSIEPSSVTIVQNEQVTVLTIFHGNIEPTAETEPADSSPGIVFSPEDPAEADKPPKEVRVIVPK